MMKGWFSGIKNAVAAMAQSAVGGDPTAAELREKWSKVQRFYLTVQNCDNESQMAKFNDQLPEIEHTMNTIVDLLVKDRHNTAHKRAESLKEQQEIVRQQIENGLADPNAAGDPGSPMSTLTSLTANHQDEDGAHDTSLSPSYELLLGLNAGGGGMGNGPSSPPVGGPGGRAFSLSSSISHGGGASTAAGGHVDPLQAGCEIIVRACQFAKHDQPRGSRRIMLKFLARLFGEADLPNKGQSLLHYGEEVTKPTLDMLSKIESQLDPRKLLTASSSSSSSTTPDKKHQRSGSSSSGTVLNSSNAVTEDHLAFVELLSVLCTKIELQPSLFAYFITTNRDNHWQTKPGHEKGEEEADAEERKKQNVPHCFLVDHLLPYLSSFPATTLNEQQQVRLTKLVLSGLLSLVKATDITIQGIMSQEERILMWVENYLRRSVLTLVTLPPNSTTGGGDSGGSSNFRVMVQNAAELVRFFDALVLLAPGSSIGGDSTLKVDLVFSEFLRSTYDKFLRSSEERSFTAAASTLNIFLKTVTTEPMLNAIALFLLVQPAVDDNNKTTTYFSTQKSIFSQSIVPKLRDLAVPVSCAALTLCNTLVMRCPSLFMRLVLGMHPRTDLPSAEEMAAAEQKQKQQQQNRGAAAEGGRSPTPQPPAVVAPQPSSFNNLQYFHDVRPLFSSKLFSEQSLCGTPISGLVVEVQAKYIGIESMLSADDWSDYRARFSTVEPVSKPHHHQSATASTIIGMNNNTGGNGGDTTMLGKLNPSMNIDPEYLNDPERCPFIAQLGQCLAGVLEQPFSITALVTQLWISVALLPHPLIVISLLQKQDSSSLDSEAAMTALSPGNANNRPLAKGTLATTLAKLSARIQKIFAADSEGDPFSRLTLYNRHVNRPFFDDSPIEHEDSLSIAMRQSKSFVEGCVVLEGFRHELGATLTWHEMGRQMSQLQPVDPHLGGGR